MRRSLGLAYVVLLAAAMLAVSAAPAWGNHVQCGDTITQDTRLDGDLIDCPGNGIVIGADGITLDLGGHTIDGVGSQNLEPCQVGIRNGPTFTSTCAPSTETGHHDVTLRNGIVRQFDAGVVVTEASRNVLRGLTVSGSNFAAAIVGESEDTSIERNLLRDNRGFAGALNLFAVTRIRISGNVVSGNGYSGIETDGIRDSLIERNSFIRNVQAGFHLHGTRNNVISHNWATGSFTGMELSDGVFDNRVFGNWVFGNTSMGIMTQEGTRRNRIERNIVFNNGRSSFGNAGGILILSEGRDQYVAENLLFGNHQGIVLGESYGGNQIERNWVSGSESDGIILGYQLSGSDRIERNIVTRSGDDGIDVDAPATVLAGNAANKNGDLGIEAVPGVTDGGGNRAFGNGNPLQCLNIACK